MSAPKGPRAPTHVSLVEGALRAADDFLLPSTILAATGLRPIDVKASLVWLHSKQAANFIEERGQTFWFATPESDQRKRTIAERKAEGEGARGGKKTHFTTLVKDRIGPGTRKSKAPTGAAE